MTVAMAERDEVQTLTEALRQPLLRLSRRMRQETLPGGLSGQDLFILGTIKKQPGIGVSELADREQISRPTMSSHAKRLEAGGWITREADAKDGRRSGFTLTPAAQRKLEAIRRRRNDWLAVRLAGLTPDERAALAAAAAPLAKLGWLEP
jgi:DNA-binding MarR family transcriptional regulator